MSRQSKILERILRGTADRAIPFDDLRLLLTTLDFDEAFVATITSTQGRA